MPKSLIAKFLVAKSLVAKPLVAKPLIAKTLMAIMFASTVLVLAGGDAYATQINEQQVDNVCGGKLQSGSAGSQKAKGCEKMCGAKLCTYGCIGPKDKKGYAHCDAVVLGRTVPGRRTGWREIVAASRGRGVTR
jgi:hypothetical protein